MKLYILKDPTNNIVRYVGVTSQTLKERLRQHIKVARRRDSKSVYMNAKDKWITFLLSIGEKPIISCVAYGLPEKIALREEKRVIDTFKRIAEGGSLLNVDNGGVYNICKEGRPWNKGRKGCYPTELKSLMKQNQPHRKDIYRFDRAGVFIDSWLSIRTMCVELGLDRRAVMRCLKGEKHFRSHKGFRFSYTPNL